MKFEGKDFPDRDGAADVVGNAETCNNASLTKVLYLLMMIMMMLKMIMTMIMIVMVMMMMMMMMMMIMIVMMMMMMMMIVVWASNFFPYFENRFHLENSETIFSIPACVLH